MVSGPAENSEVAVKVIELEECLGSGTRFVGLFATRHFLWDRRIVETVFCGRYEFAVLLFLLGMKSPQLFFSFSGVGEKAKVTIVRLAVLLIGIPELELLPQFFDKTVLIFL